MAKCDGDFCNVIGFKGTKHFGCYSRLKLFSFNKGCVKYLLSSNPEVELKIILVSIRKHKYCDEDSIEHYSVPAIISLHDCVMCFVSNEVADRRFLFAFQCIFRISS